MRASRILQGKMTMESSLIESRLAQDISGDGPLPELMASVGYLFYHWSVLEHALVDEIRRLRLEGGDNGKNLIRVRGTLRERLAEWRALIGLKARGNRGLLEAVADLAGQIERLQATRNLIGQSFAGVSTHARDGEPSITCAAGDITAPGGDARRITLSELKGILDEIQDCRGRIATIERSG